MNTTTVHCRDDAFKTAVLINSRLGIKPDWLRKVYRCLDRMHEPDISPEDISTVISEITLRTAEFQYGAGLPVSGIITAQTRLALIHSFPELGITLIGPHLEPRLILDTSRTESAQYDALIELMRHQAAFVYDLDAVPQIIAVRGTKKTARGYEQTGSAKIYAQTPYGSRTHYCAAKPDYADAFAAVLWQENGEKHVMHFPCVVNPGSCRPQGTAHLNNGQYFYKIGWHRTREPLHIEAVRAMSAQWPSDWINDIAPDSIRYIALESTSPIEVIRSTGTSLDISDDDIRRAENAVAHRDPEYVDMMQIKINIHTCAFDRASSLGCQNILPRDYAEFMQCLVRLGNLQYNQYGMRLDIPYLLCDASSAG